MVYPYLPYNYPQPYYQPQQMQQPAQPNGILWVGSEMEAQNYPVAPNNAVALWDSTKPAIYLKQTDASGKPTVKVYTLSERLETPQIKQDSSEYKVTDFALKSDVEAISAALVAIKDDVKALKRNAKRKEVVDVDDE